MQILAWEMPAISASFLEDRRGYFEVGIAGTPDERISEARAGRQHLDADLARVRIGNCRLLHQFQDFGAAEPSDTDVLPYHTVSIAKPVHCDCEGQLLDEHLKRPAGRHPSPDTPARRPK